MKKIFAIMSISLFLLALCSCNNDHNVVSLPTSTELLVSTSDVDTSLATTTAIETTVVETTVPFITTSSSLSDTTGGDFYEDDTEVKVWTDPVDERIMDAFYTTHASHIKFAAIRLGDDKYAIYPLNGIKFDYFHIVADGNELLSAYDFSGETIMLCDADARFVSGGIAGFNYDPYIEYVYTHRPLQVSEIANCYWIARFDKNADTSWGIWKAKSNGTQYIISSLYEMGIGQYYVAISDEGVSIYTSLDDLKSIF